MALLLFTEPNTLYPENKFVLQSFLVLFHRSITYSAAPTNLSDSNFQLCGTISQVFQNSITAMLRLFFRLLPFVFFSTWVFFHKHSWILAQQGSLVTAHYHFHLLRRYRDISQVITAESSPQHIAKDQTQTGNALFSSASCQPLICIHHYYCYSNQQSILCVLRSPPHHFCFSGNRSYHSWCSYISLVTMVFSNSHSRFRPAIGLLLGKIFPLGKFK